MTLRRYIAALLALAALPSTAMAQASFTRKEWGGTCPVGGSVVVPFNAYRKFWKAQNQDTTQITITEGATLGSVIQLDPAAGAGRQGGYVDSTGATTVEQITIACASGKLFMFAEYQ